MATLTKDNANILPTETSLSEAAKLEVFDEKGTKIPFGTLISKQKTVVVFIRHFFCGMCQNFVAQLADIPKDIQEQAGVKIIVIGCGDYPLIPNYRNNSNFYGEVYAEPTRKLYRTLGMTLQNFDATPKDQTPKTYVAKNKMAGIARSIWGIRNPLHIGKQGNFSQLGGEFIMGPGNVCSFSHRMVHTEDHLEPHDLMAAAGVSYNT